MKITFLHEKFQEEEFVKAPSRMLPSDEWQKSAVDDFTKLRNFLVSKFEENECSSSIQKYQVQRILTELPKFSTVHNVSQSSKLKILELMLDRMDTIEKGETITYEIGIWLYTTLATLLIPLEPNAYHLLREVARKCSKIRSNLEPDSTTDKYVPLNLIICIIARYFNQLDLSD